MNQKTPLSKKLLPLLLTILVILVDQITKALVVKYIPRLDFFSDEDSKK